MAKTDTAIRIARIAATIHTVAQARAVLGKTASILHEAYGRTDEITGADNRAAAIDLLDEANAYAQKVYADLPSDGAHQQDVVSAVMAARVGGALGTAERAIRRVEDAANAVYWDYFGALEQTLEAVGGGIGKGIQSVTNAAAGGAWALIKAAWPTMLIVLAVLAGLIYLRYFLRRKAA